MAFLSKNTIIRALKSLKEAEVQVSAPCLSAIQYFIALDRFYHQEEGKEESVSTNPLMEDQTSEISQGTFLDCSSKDKKREFISYVSDVISLDDGNYLKTIRDLYVGDKNIQGTINSNFFAGSSVDISRKSPDKVDYPQQGKWPLLYALNGNVYRDENYYSNLHYYLTTKEVRFAMVIWLLRKDDFENLSVEVFRNKLLEKYTQCFVDTLIPDEDPSYNEYMDSFEVSILPEVASINKFDFLMNKEEKENIQKSYSRQQIFYGAPGTGKSRYVDDVCKKYVHYRITFHPDTDYAAFVGCYKPKSNKKNMLTGNSLNETQLLSCFFNSNDKNKYPNATKARYLYEALTHTKDIRDLGLDANSVAQKLVDNGFKGCPYTTEANCMYNIYDWLQQDGFIVDNKITYEFVPQTFLKAYIEAWRNQASGTPVYLVIEEINRGNCAQIFGDIFQLLDRDNDGFSQYEVDADTDMQEYISSVGLVLSGVKDSDGNDISAEVASGKLLKLPDNLYIWATMNTSDQSLFPIDSAFKRRWDWKYLPIENAGKKWKIKVNGNEYDWYAFLEAVNKEVFTLTHSEDKQLGYFFAKAKDGVIDAETLVNKVYFYLWTDVFKDYDYESQKAFRKPNSNDPIAFKNFFEDLKNDEKVNEGVAEQVLINLELEKLNKPQDSFA